MAHFLIQNTHSADECQGLYEEAVSAGGAPALLKQYPYFCTCPVGVHGATVIVEAATEEDVRKQLEQFPKYAAGTKVINGEILELP